MPHRKHSTRFPSQLKVGDQIHIGPDRYATVTKTAAPEKPEDPWTVFHDGSDIGRKGVNCPKSLRVPIKREDTPPTPQA